MGQNDMFLDFYIKWEGERVNQTHTYTYICICRSIVAAKLLMKWSANEMQIYNCLVIWQYVCIYLCTYGWHELTSVLSCPKVRLDGQGECMCIGCVSYSWCGWCNDDLYIYINFMCIHEFLDTNLHAIMSCT